MKNFVRLEIETPVTRAGIESYVALDSVIKFLRAPEQWLEDAEWNSIEG